MLEITGAAAVIKKIYGSFKTAAKEKKWSPGIDWQRKRPVSQSKKNEYGVRCGAH